MIFSSESVKNKKNKESNTYQKYNFSIDVFFIINFGPILKDLSQNFVFRHFPPFTIFAQLCKIIPCCISPHQKTELHKSSQSLICQVTQDHPGKISFYIPPNPKFSSHCIGKSWQMIGLESDKNYSTGHSINGNLAEKKSTGKETCQTYLTIFSTPRCVPSKDFSRAALSKL